MGKRGKWPVGGYAPGGYACCRCTTCDEYFMAAKRAYTCAECTIQNLLAERDALKAEVGRVKVLEDVLREIANGAFNDNGDVTMDHGHMIRAFFKARAALEGEE